MSAISVLVVEDEAVAADAHRAYVERVPGFTVVGVARTGREALRALERAPVDVLLLDFRLPDLHGLEVCRAVRSAGYACDVIAVTSVRDLGAVRAAVAAGVVQYVLKPFTFRVLADKLERYRDFRTAVSRGEAAAQSEVDRALASLRGADHDVLPTGVAGETLEAVAAALRGAGGALTAVEVAAACGASRVTARRYLEHLVEAGAAHRSARYGETGRPTIEYRWASADPR